MWSVLLKRSSKKIIRPDNPGRIFPKYPAPSFSAKDLRICGSVYFWIGAGHLPGYCPGFVPRPDYPGRTFRKYPPPSKMSKDLKKSKSGLRPDIWPDILLVLYLRPDYPGGADYTALT